MSQATQRQTALVTGWVLIPLDPSHLRASGPLSLRFADVALNGYPSVSDIELHVQLTGI